MSNLEKARRDMLFAARALMAYRAGQRGDLALVGAVLEAEHYAHVRGLFKSLCG